MRTISCLYGIFHRFDQSYRGQSTFVGLKAQLLAAICALTICFIPFNVAKILLVQPAGIPFRLAINAVMLLAAAHALREVCRGRSQAAGNQLVLSTTGGVLAIVLLVPNFPEPLSGAFQNLIFGLVYLLIAVVFATSRVSWLILGITVASQVAFHLHAFHDIAATDASRSTAQTILRDGLIATGFIFSIGIALVRILGFAQQHSEESLAATRSTNENLERLVRERTLDLEAATRRANEASRAKSDFLANMSHEIRTPLNGIVASADLLLNHDDLPSSVAAEARVIVDSGEVLARLIGDILDLSKIEAGKLDLEMRPFELRRSVTDSVALAANPAEPDRAPVQIQIDPTLGSHYQGDALRLRQVLINLVANARKFTPSDGHIELTVTSAEPDADPSFLRFAVRDSGLGMDAPTLARVFERFTQADSSITRRHGGTGLGLAISSRLVSMMKGKLTAESAPNRGSTFSFTIPLSSVDSEAVPKTEIPPLASLGLHVLAVEDNPINRKILAAQLAKIGCQCTLAEDGAAALKILEIEAPPDIILMDCHMPRMDGWETTRRIRAAPNHLAVPSTIPIVALSAAVFDEERARCTSVGMSGFLAKPFKISDLHHTLALFDAARSGRSPSSTDSSEQTAFADVNRRTDPSVSDQDVAPNLPQN